MSGDDRQTQSDHHKLASNPNWHCPRAKSSVVQAGPTSSVFVMSGQLGGDPSWLQLPLSNIGRTGSPVSDQLGGNPIMAAVSLTCDL